MISLFLIMTKKRKMLEIIIWKEKAQDKKKEAAELVIIYDGEWKNDKQDGKGILYYHKDPFTGERYEGDFKNGKKEGKGIIYFNNGDRIMGDFSNDIPIGKHVRLTKNGEVITNFY